MCENGVHETVCRYKTEFENLKNDIAKVTPTWAPDRYLITIECKNFRKGGLRWTIFQEGLNPIELGVDIQDR